MRFSTTMVVTLLGTTTNALAIPQFLTTSGAQGLPLTGLQSASATLSAYVSGDLSDITNLINSASGDASAQSTLITKVNLDLQDIVKQIKIAASSVSTATLGAATDLNPVQVSTLIAIIQSFQTVLQDIQTTIQNGLASLPAQTQAALQSEISAIQKAVPLITAPLTAYANEVQADSSASGNLTGLQGVIQAVANAANSILGNLGLGSVSGNVVATVGGASSAGVGGLNTGALGGGVIGSGGAIGGGGGLLGTGINLRRQVPGLSGLPGVSIATEVVAEVEALLAGLSGGN